MNILKPADGNKTQMERNKRSYLNTKQKENIILAIALELHKYKKVHFSLWPKETRRTAHSTHRSRVRSLRLEEARPRCTNVVAFLSLWDVREKRLVFVVRAETISRLVFICFSSKLARDVLGFLLLRSEKAEKQEAFLQHHQYTV